MSKTRERIRETRLRYQKGLGQNFIYDDDILASLVEAAGVRPGDCIVEIGPGAGGLTKHLLERAGQVIAVELDERLIPILRVSLEAYPHFTLVQGDAMTVDFKALTAGAEGPVSIVANIPYYITSPLITRLLEVYPERISLMVQKEVADKLVSGPGDEGWGLLPLKCQYLYDVHKAMDVPAACFTPVPKVDSAFIVMDRREKKAADAVCEEDFYRVAQAAFALRRKTMVNGLCAAFHMERGDAVSLVEKAGLDEKIRGEKLTIGEMARLSDAYSAWKESEQ